MSDTVQEIKNKLDIAEVIRTYVPLIPAGKNLKANCPFHKEKSPSFMVSPDRQMWHCFGCGEGGDLFKFVMKYENIEFFEALKLLALKAGVEIKVSSGVSDPYKQLYEINRIAKDFFCSNLHDKSSAFQGSASAYLKERGLKAETIRDFEIGLSLTPSDSLLRHLVSQKKSLPDIEKAGLVFKSERGTYWDRFRGRLMFPLYNSFGKVIGFTGRVLPAFQTGSGMDAAKYVNSPETPIFSKSKMLYGFHLSKNSIRDSRTAIVVEGQMDFLMMWQDGVKNVVASSGTALTAEHLNILRRAADNLILSFDSDDAGFAAAERSIDTASSLDFNVKLLTLEGSYKDPADVVCASPGLIKELVAKTVPATEYYFNRYLMPGLDLPDFKKNLRLILSKIKNIASAVEREHYIKELSARARLNESTLVEEMSLLSEQKKETFKPKNQSQPQKLHANEQFSRKENISNSVLSILSSYPDLKNDAADFAACFSADYKTLYDCLENEGFKNISENLLPLANFVSLHPSLPGATSAIGMKVELQKLLRQLKSEYLKERREILRQDIAKYESQQDEAGLSHALKEFDSVTKELHNVTY